LAEPLKKVMQLMYDNLKCKIKFVYTNINGFKPLKVIQNHNFTSYLGGCKNGRLGLKEEYRYASLNDGDTF